jgi:predicted TIM-barrel fold metal-dependent hydrolase
MRINCHAHIFNLQCILTSETIDIIVGRLSETSVAFAADGVRGVLESIRDDPRYLSDEDLLRLFLEKIGVSAAFRNAANRISNPLLAESVFTGLESVSVSALDDILAELSKQFDKSDTPGGGIRDLFQTLRIALKPNCTAVADEILKDMDADDALVALMMDITSDDELERDRVLFERQLRETQEAMLQRPGRILPFVAVNTKRKAHRGILERAIGEMGFVGVKLYPSLGYPIANSEAMVEVIDFCADRTLPVTMHCNHGGFAKNKASVAFCDPEHWVDHLARQPETRICFAHFGGIEGLFGTTSEETEWTNHIVQLMQEFDNVYADISFHVDIMGAKQQAIRLKYFETLKGFLARPRIRDRIVFGTDSWLLRMHLGERAFRQFFEDHLTPAEFTRIADTNPRRFLGLPSAGVPAGPNIRGYMDVLVANRTQVGARPAAWLQAAVGADVKFLPQRSPPHWTMSNAAHRVANAVMRGQMTQSHLNADFAVRGTLRMKELLYFRGGQPGTTQFEQQVDSIAQRLAEVALQNAVRREDFVEEASAIAAIRDVVATANATVSELGVVIDSQFVFAEEPQ